MHRRPSTLLFIEPVAGIEGPRACSGSRSLGEHGIDRHRAICVLALWHSGDLVRRSAFDCSRARQAPARRSLETSWR